MIWNTTITWQEMLTQVVVVSLLISACWFSGMYGATADTEYLNGGVTSKKMVEVSCEHSYDCNCYESCSGTGSTRSCTTTCSTCYDHNEDYDWTVSTTVGSFNVARVDRQGEDEPKDWTKIKKGQPATLSQGYTNYIKAVPESLFNSAELHLEKFATMIPSYPSRYNYIKVDRVIPVGVVIPDLAAFNEQLSKRLIEIGPAKQANINIVVVATSDQSYRYALESAWLGGKKNDVTVIVGAPEYPKILWADVITLGQNAGNALLAVEIRDQIVDQGEFNAQTINTISNIVLNTFSRKAMKDFEYLEDSIEPPTWVIIASVLIAIFGSIFGTVFFHYFDLSQGRFVSSTRNKYRKYR